MTVLLLAVALYLIATALLVRALARGVDNPHGWTIPALLAVLFHAGFHVDAWQSANGLDMHFFAALSLVGVGMAGLTTAVLPAANDSGPISIGVSCNGTHTVTHRSVENGQ